MPIVVLVLNKIYMFKHFISLASTLIIVFLVEKGANVEAKIEEKLLFI